ncbi:MAG: hypothetical protein QXG39_01865 [Candidatus Aenigmatarchaeota archaeon]
MNLELGRQILEFLRVNLFNPALFEYPKSFIGRLRIALSLRLINFGGDRVIVVSDHPAFTFLDRGVRPHVMDYLRGKVVPIRTKEGRVIFRTVSDKSLREGKWRHKGIPAQRYIETAISKLKDSLQIRNIFARIEKMIRGR